MKRRLTNVWNREQMITVIKEVGKYSLCENEKGIRFYHPTKLLREIK